MNDEAAYTLLYYDEVVTRRAVLFKDIIDTAVEAIIEREESDFYEVDVAEMQFYYVDETRPIDQQKVLITNELPVKLPELIHVSLVVKHVNSKHWHKESNYKLTLGNVQPYF